MTVRAALIKVQIARKDLQVPEDAYRAMLKRLTGQDSAGKCTEAQLDTVLAEFRAKGWKPKVIAGGRAGKPVRKARAAPADHPAARKARALWLSLWNLGEVRDSSEAALEAFARRQLGVERLQWADQALTYKLIEALKAMAERAGWSQQLDKSHRGFEVLILKRRLVSAQTVRRLERGDECVRPPHLAGLTEGQLDTLISANGVILRALPEAGG